MGIAQVRGLVVVCLTALLLGGCASNQPEEPMEAPEEVAPPPAPTPVKPPEPVVVKPMVRGGKISYGQETFQGIFYFDFDQAIVKRAGHVELNRHAEFLTGDRTLRVRLEGHTDERGTREYNMALGERRSNAIRAYLVAQGVSASQIEVVSYGEENPADPGHSESAWAMNRRVEIVYR